MGAGAAGLQIAYKAERILENVDLQIYEKNHEIGGTWLENVRFVPQSVAVRSSRDLRRLIFHSAHRQSHPPLSLVRFANLSPCHDWLEISWVHLRHSKPFIVGSTNSKKMHICLHALTSFTLSSSQFNWNRNPNWSAYYSSSEEIWQYMKDTATKYDLEKYVQLNTRVESATWDETAGQWRLQIVGPGEKHFEDSCDVLLNGSGNLNSWKWPAIPGLDVFKGKLMHSAAWDDSYDVSGKTVAVIGGGSSAVQIIPAIQPKAGKLTAFIRSPGWISTGYGAKFAGPDGSNFQFTEEQQKKFKDDPEGYVKYCKDIEGELNKRFTLVRTIRFPTDNFRRVPTCS